MRAFKIYTLLTAFLAAGIATVLIFDTYFKDFWNIANCNTEGGYEAGQFMTDCYSIDDEDRYSSGSLVLGIQDESVQSIREADVIILGNSRTLRSFATTAMDDYFTSKGLRYYVLATEGTSFRGTIWTLNNVEMDPEFLLINSEIFAVDAVPEAFGEIIANPEAYRTRFEFFDAAQDLQRWSCSNDIPWLSEFYCKGTDRARWRSHQTGQISWDLVAAPEQQKLVRARSGGERNLAEYTGHARIFFDSINIEPKCSILYQVDSPAADPGVLAAMGNVLGMQAISTNLDDLYSYDNSHLDRPNSERWASAFVSMLDAAIDNCRNGNFEVTSPFDGESLMTDGEGLEDWAVPEDVKLRTGVQDERTTGAIDVVGFTETSQRITLTARDTPVKAGETWEFTVNAWSEQSPNIRLNMMRSCDRGPVEGTNDIGLVLPYPTTLSIQHTFENDHPCVALMLQNLSKEGTVDLNVGGYTLLKIADTPSNANAMD